jgi:hypothetical protein
MLSPLFTSTPLPIIVITVMHVLLGITLVVWSEAFEQQGTIWKDNKRDGNEVGKGMESLWATRL